MPLTVSEIIARPVSLEFESGEYCICNPALVPVSMVSGNLLSSANGGSNTNAIDCGLVAHCQIAENNLRVGPRA